MVLRTTRMAFRSLRRRPAFTSLAVVTIALGAGANAAVSSVAYNVLVKPLAFREPERLVAVWPGQFMSQVDLRYLREHERGLSGIAGVSPGWSFALSGAGEPSQIVIDRVSGNLFETLGATPLIGRVARSDEERPGSPRVLVLSHRFWVARFGADRSVIGRVVKLDDQPHEIIGVMPSSFEILTQHTDAWAPLPADPRAFYDKLNFTLLVGRVAPGVDIEQADRDFKALMPRMRADLGYPATYGQTAAIQDLRAASTGDMRSSLFVLAAAVVLMLLIAGANLGTLLVASGTARAREFAVHAAIGAPRLTIASLQLSEGLLLAAGGAVAGLLIAFTSLPALVRLLPPDTPRTGEIRIDATIIFAVIGASLVVAVLFGAAPSLASARRHGASQLRDGGSTEARSVRKTYGLMVAVEIALALVLTIGAGLMLQTLWNLRAVAPGIDVDRLLTLKLLPTSASYQTPGAIAAYYDQVLSRIASVPGVTAVGAIQHLPFSGTTWVDAFEVERRPITAGEARPTAGFKLITGDYFRAVGQRILVGRSFTSADRALQDPPLIVNESFARRYFRNAQAAIGARIRTGRVGGTWVPIIGVVSDVRTVSLDKAPEPEFYKVVTGTSIPAMMVAVRTPADPLAIAAAVREAVWSVDRNVPIADLQPMRVMVGTTLRQPRLLLTLLGGFAVIGVALSVVGVYGVVAFAIVRRRREIGIRMALGADSASIVVLMVKESAGYAAAGLVTGVAIALAVSRIMKGLLFEVPPTDPSTYCGVAIIVAAVVVIASYSPAHRAGSINPADLLRG